jgi:hypothetical protein
MGRQVAAKSNIAQQKMTFADWFYDLRELAGEDDWGELSGQMPTLIVLWNGGATVAQALDMVSVILAPVPRAVK